MAFDFKLSLSVSSSPKFHRGESRMGQWADKYFDRLVELEGTEHLKIKQQVLERQQILAAAPDRWEGLVEGILEETNDLNNMRPGLVEIKDESRNTFQV